MSHLPNVGHLMSSAWHQFTRDWRLTAGISLWFLLPGGISILNDFLQLYIPFFGRENETAVFSIFFLSLLITLPLIVLNIIIYLMTPIRLSRLMLQSDTQHPDDRTAKSPWPWDLFGPVLWITTLLILVFLACFFAGAAAGGIVAAVAHFGFHTSRFVTAIIGLSIGFLAIFLPAIYFGTLFSQSGFLLIEDDVHGTGALRRSAQLVRGRWWGVFGRLLLNEFILCLVMLTIFVVVFALVIFFIWVILGLDFSNARSVLLNLSNVDPSIPAQFMVMMFTINTLATLLPIALQILITPYFMTFTVKLFHALKASR